MMQKNKNSAETGATIGERFRAAREGRDVTPSEVAKTTHMMIKHIVAMEENDFDSMGPAIYVKGFIKLYAEYLDMDTGEIVQEYLRLTQRKKPRSAIAKQSHPAVPKRTPRQNDFGKNVQKSVQKAVSTAKTIPGRIPKKAVKTWAVNGLAGLLLCTVALGLLLGIKGCVSLAQKRSAAKQSLKRAESAFIQEPAEPYINDIK